MLADLYAGNVAFIHLDATTTIGAMKQGRFVLPASSTKTRAKSFPDAPSAHEAGIDNCDLTGWWSIATPKDTPQPIRDRLEKIYNDYVASPDHEKFMAQIGCQAFPGNHSSAAAALANEIKAWQEYVRIAKIKQI